MPDEGEFSFIRRALRPLAAAAPHAFDLADDAAALAEAGPLADIVVTTDMLVAGVHFLDDDPYDLIARKALRVNLSDLAAMGAAPFAYLLSVAWPPSTGRQQRDDFAAGLAVDQAEFGIVLLGGDTVASPGPLTVSITAFGRAGPHGVVKRRGARPGDRLVATGTIGDAGLGLQILSGDVAVLFGGDELIDRYRLPRPRTSCGAAVAENAGACIDISDGLVADAAHIAACSGVRIVVEADRVPLSAPAQAWADDQPDRLAAVAALCGAGDDYELLASAAPDRAQSLVSACEAAGVGAAVIGRVEAGEGVVLIDANGDPVPIESAGFTHF